MKQQILILGLIVLTNCLWAQNKNNYLKDNRFDLHEEEFRFPQMDYKIIGFGALHGSRKTEIAEQQLLKSLIKKGKIGFYIMETDFSIGHYFNQYLQTSDTLLLKDLVTHYGIRVPQEKTIEVYEKWKKLRKIWNATPEQNRFEVIGINPIVSYKYTFRHLIKLIKADSKDWSLLQEIKHQVKIDTSDFSPYYDSFSKTLLQKFVQDYEKNLEQRNALISSPKAFNHLLINIKHSFEKYEREALIYENYLALQAHYDFEDKQQFFRYGMAHLEKGRASYQNYSFFFTKLIEGKIYSPKEILTVTGYLTQSRVLWDSKYDESGNYIGYTTKGGFGISDYWKEYFRGIQKLKKNKLSDLTLFRLNKDDSPYHTGKPDLVEIRMFLSPSNTHVVKNKPTTKFMDYAILITNSEASQPIEELESQ